VKTFKEIRTSTKLEEVELEHFGIQVEESLELSDLPPVMENETKQNHSQPHDPPAVLIMKRKSIRLFPNGQRVALYYVDKINKYVTVPYTSMQWSASVEEEISSTDNLKSIVESHKVGPKTSNEIFDIFNRLNEANKMKFLQMAEEDFNNLLNFVKKNR
jgi:hypothetical protein